VIKGSEVRPGRLPDRPAVFSTAGRRELCQGRKFPCRDLMTLLEAARWAPSSYNLQTLAHAVRTPRYAGLAGVF